jgi:ABC-2 type transport system permease protein
MNTTVMLAWREWIRFFRQRHRVIAALGQPILFWLLFGTGMHQSFRGGGSDFMSYYLPGTIALILMFTAIFATISIIEDRREGFLQGVLVAPVSRWHIAAGKVLGGGAIAWVQAMIFLLLALLVGSVPWSTSIPGLLLLMALTAVGLTALGVVFAWPMDSTQGFHAVMNLVLMPLWLLSGAFFPIPLLGDSAATGQIVIHWVMRLNPLSYAVAGMRQMVFPSQTLGSELWQPSLALCWLVTIVFVMVTVCLAVRAVQRPSKGELK